MRIFATREGVASERGKSVGACNAVINVARFSAPSSAVSTRYVISVMATRV